MKFIDRESEVPHIIKIILKSCFVKFSFNKLLICANLSNFPHVINLLSLNPAIFLYNYNALPIIPDTASSELNTFSNISTLLSSTNFPFQNFHAAKIEENNKGFLISASIGDGSELLESMNPCSCLMLMLGLLLISINQALWFSSSMISKPITCRS